ncbi:MAG: polysaccharide pyruvyl transferase CsaB, partial [Meiothermus sp.]
MVVALSGYYGFHNAGDEALLEAIVQEVKVRGHTPLVLSKNPA